MQIPEDFMIIYDWSAASVPPPYHYEYQILLHASGEGELRFTPDYPSIETPVWSAQYHLQEEDLGIIYSIIEEYNLLQAKWRRPARHIVGGEQAWCQIKAHRVTYTIPAELTLRDRVRAEKLYTAVKATLPPKTWDAIWKKYEDYRCR